MTHKRNMPSKENIRKFWSNYLISIGKFDSEEEFFESDYCFGCGLDLPTQRAHITPRYKFRDDSLENIHLLCSYCHQATEELEDRDKYFDWILKRHPLDVLAIIAINNDSIQSFFNFLPDSILDHFLKVRKY